MAVRHCCCCCCCRWGEGVDSTNFEQRVATSLTAVAERMWSVGPEQPIEDVRARLTSQRCRLVRAGVQAAPVGQDSWPYFDPPCGVGGNGGDGAM
jgi:hypothetical protein